MADTKCTAATPLPASSREEDFFHAPTKKNGKKTQEEEFYWKFSKKIQRQRYPTFKLPKSSGFQIAARTEVRIQAVVPGLSFQPVEWIEADKLILIPTNE